MKGNKNVSGKRWYWTKKRTHGCYKERYWAFLNTMNGCIFVGVVDDGSIYTPFQK